MSASENSKEEQINESPDKDFWSVLGMTFSTVFLAELGDKTQIATLLLTTQSGRPVVVFFGAAIALICSSLVGVVLGRWLSTIVPPIRFKYMAGVLMIGIGTWIGLQAAKSMIN